MSTFNLIFLLACLSTLTLNIKINKGTVFLKSITAAHEDPYKVQLLFKDTVSRVELALSQSSKIHIEAKLQFSSSQFVPEFVSFRLRHSQFENLTNPVLATYDTVQESFNAVIDLGDPKHIKHLSGDYKLEAIVSDDLLENQVRKIIASCKIVFRHSMNDAGLSELHYQIPSTIMTDPPATRVDPPQIFTAFAVLLIVGFTLVFLYGLSYLNVNFKLFPTDSSVGLITNIGFLGVLATVLYFLLQFWLNWTFLETLQNLLLIILPTAFIANYALVNVRKQ